MTEQSTGPLAGVTIVDMSTFVLGPYATQTLGDLGADIIKVESPEGDPYRRSGRSSRNEGMSPGFMTINRNKRSVVIDVKTADGQAAVRKLLATADAFIHNVRADGMKRIGLDYESIAKIKPDLVYVHCVGYGSEGVNAGRQAFDDLIQAASGAADLIPRVDGSGELRMLPTIAADKVTGLHAVYAVLAALFHRQRTGQGQFVEVPMLECFTSFLLVEHLYGMAFDPPTNHIGDTRTLSIERKPYKTKDGYIAILPASREGNDLFLKLGGIEDAYNSERFLSAKNSKDKIIAYYEMMRDAAASRTTDEWLKLCAENHIPAMRANTLDTVIDDPHLKSVNFFQIREHESEGRWRAMKPPVKFSKTPIRIRRNPPRLGQHSEELAPKGKAK
jgi:crotonobetainyl-CoA:carnitine CoA-transferase CaiB-like acyl-CoA transferase